MSELLVDIHAPATKTATPISEHFEEGLGKWGRVETALAIAERGMEFVFSRGPSSYDTVAGTVNVLEPRLVKQNDGYAVFVRPTQIELPRIDAIRNISKAIGSGVPELNHPDIRIASRDKIVTNEIIGKLGFHKDYASWEKCMSFDDALDHISEDKVVIKPRNGMRSQNIHIATKADAALLHSSGDLDNGSWIIEERLDLSHPIPLKGLRPEDDEVIQFVNDKTLPKELRVYSFGKSDDGMFAAHCVMRAARSGDTHLNNDRWVFLNPDAVPETVIDQTDAIMSAFSEYSGVHEIHAATDWVYATTTAIPEPHWLPMEVNTGEPQLVYQHEHAETARLQASMLAEQLERVAERRSTVY